MTAVHRFVSHCCFPAPAGMVYNEKRATLAFAASDVRYGMESNKRAGANNTRHDIGGPNDIRLEYNPCGCVYEVICRLS